MNIFSLFMLFAIIITLLILLPDILPFCLCCKKTKPRFFFKIHKAFGIFPKYNKSKSLCKKCCSKYDMENMDDFKKLDKARRKAENDSFKL